MAYFLLPLLALSLILSGCDKSSETASPKPPTVKAIQGQQLFLSNCAACHNGGGDPPRPNAVVLNSATLSQDSAFLKLLREPTSSMMRAFSPQELSDADAYQILLYLREAKTTPQSGG